MAFLPITSVYQVRIATSEGSSIHLIEAASTMDAFRQALLNYSPDAVLHSLSAQPHRSDKSELVAA